MSSTSPLSATDVFTSVNDILDSVCTSRRSKLSFELLVQRPGSLGPSPGIGIERLDLGFDWDRDRILAKPQAPLTLLTPEDVAEITASVRLGTSYHAYQQHRACQAQIHQLQNDNARLIAEIADLKAQAARNG